jgi:hypothetical protein
VTRVKATRTIADHYEFDTQSGAGPLPEMDHEYGLTFEKAVLATSHTLIHVIYANIYCVELRALQK